MVEILICTILICLSGLDLIISFSSVLLSLFVCTLKHLYVYIKLGMVFVVDMGRVPVTAELNLREITIMEYFSVTINTSLLVLKYLFQVWQM